MRLGYVIVYVVDVAATVEFYERAFGLQRRFLHESGQYAEMETGSTALAFAQESFIAATHGPFRHNRLNEEPAGSEIAFIVEDVAAAYKKAVAAGATIGSTPREMPWGQIVAYIRDPNGCLIELCSPMEP